MSRVAKWLLVLLFFAPSAWAQYGYLPIVQSEANVNGSSPVTCQYRNNVVSGNNAVVSFSWETASGTTPTVSGTKTGAFTQDFIDVSHNIRFAVYHAAFTSSGNETITVTEAGAGFFNVQCSEFLPLFSMTVDASASSYTTGTPGTVTETATTTVNGDVIYCHFGGFASGGIFTQNSGNMTSAVRGSDSSAAVSFVAGTNGSKSCTVNNFTNSEVAGVIIAYKANSIAIRSPATIPDAALSTSYAYTMLATGGAGAYTWSITSGALPPGLSLNSSTGAITGTPTSSVGPITFQVTDGTHTTTQVTTLNVDTAFNSISILQSKSDANSLTGTLAFTSNVTSGSLIVATGGYFFGHAQTIGCSDTLGTPFKLLQHASYGPTTAVSPQWITQDIVAGIAPSGGADTVSCGNVNAIYEIANAQFSGSDNVATPNAGTSASPITSNSLTTLVPNEILITSASGYTGATSMTASAPFTGINSGTADEIASRIVTTVTGYTSSFVMTGNTDGHWGIILAGFRPAANGTPAPSVGSNTPAHTAIIDFKPHHYRVPWVMKRNELRIETI